MKLFLAYLSVCACTVTTSVLATGRVAHLRGVEGSVGNNVGDSASIVESAEGLFSPQEGIEGGADKHHDDHRQLVFETLGTTWSYQLKNKGTHKVMSVEGGVALNGKRIMAEQHTYGKCHPGQWFYPRSHDGKNSAYLKAMAGWSMCVDLDGGVCKAGTKVHTWTCYDGANQRWTLEKDETITHNSCPKNLVLAESSDGSIILAENDHSDKMKWHKKNVHEEEFHPFGTCIVEDPNKEKPDPEEQFYLESKSNGKVFKVESGVVVNGAKLVAVTHENKNYTCGDRSLIFEMGFSEGDGPVLGLTMDLLGMGKGTIRSVGAPRMCLDLEHGPDAGCDVGNAVVVWECHGERNQRWKLDDEGYLVSDRCPHMVLAETGDGTIKLANKQDSTNNKWKKFDMAWQRERQKCDFDIKNQGNKKYFDVAGGFAHDGTDLVAWEFNRPKTDNYIPNFMNQIFARSGDTDAQITSLAGTNMCMDLENGSCIAGTNVRIKSCAYQSGTAATPVQHQMWNLENDGTITSSKCPKNLVLAEASNGSIILANNENTPMMKWIIGDNPEWHHNQPK